jgi:Carbohydrate-binding module 64/Glycosyl hydrolases family 43
MGLATATNIEGPWTDAGEVTRVNYPIDPNVSWGPNNTLYIEWGSWTGGGINMHVLNPSTGKLSTTDHNLWHIANGIENATIAFNSPYYYLFGSRGSCCSGVNSTYYTVVARSTSITGPYLDKNGVNINSGGGTTILTGSSPKIAAGGGDAFDDGSTKRLAYHYYDANNNGRETLDIRTMTFSNGWPVLSAPLSSSSPTATPTRTLGASATLTSTRTLTPGAGPTATPTRTLGASATRTPTPGSSGSTCSPVTASIAAPFTFDGAGTFCWQSGNLGAYINSWNAASVTVNGLDVTNIYVATGGLPARVNGFWYVSYTSNVAWGHFEAR